MMAGIVEPFFYCLFASLIWAPAIFLTASVIARGGKNINGASALSGKLWPAALIIAALPVLLAPLAATLGLSLRAPAPLPPMMEAAGPASAPIEAPAFAGAEKPDAVSLADIISMAAILYFYGFLMLFALAAVRHIWFAYRLNYAFELDEPRLEAALESWRVRIGVKSRPRYVFSHVVSSVCVYGFFRPVIVMPMHLLDRVSIEDAALMGAHEMAHIKRGDVGLFALCSIVKAVFWFNPFMHQICARATLTAEQGADALVLASGVNRRQYAHCFVQGLRLAADARYGFAGELIPSFTPFDKRSRRQRLDAILSGAPERNALTLTAKIGLSASAALAAALAFAQAAFAVSPPAIEDALPVRPVEGEITLGYGEKSKLLGDDRPSHEGVDLRAAKGSPVRASGAGKIIAATGNYNGQKSWGNVVVIDHGHGLITRYAHLDSYKVEKGDHVDAGDIIGTVGATGVASGPHLHFEVISEGENLDPTALVASIPAASASQKTHATMKRNVQLAKAPTAFASAALAEPSDTFSSSQHSVRSASATAATQKSQEHAGNRNELEKILHKLEARLRKQFEDFDPFNGLEDMTFDFDELENIEDWTEIFEKNRIELANLGATNVPEMSYADAKNYFNEEKLEALREQQADAREAAADAIEEMRDRLAEQRQEREETLRDIREQARDRAREQKEREREMREERKQHAAEMKRMRLEAERQVAHEKQAWAHEYDGDITESELLEQQEQALLNAKENLELQLAEIERRRKELNESE